MKALLAALMLMTPVALAGKAGVAPGVFRSVGKQVAPVELAEARRYEAAAGERLTIDPNLRLTRPADAVRVEISADAGLALRQRVRRDDLGPHAAGLIDLPPLEVTVLEEGRHHVNITVFMRGSWGERFRSFSVPIATPGGAKAASKRSDLKSGASGELLRVMPAAQTD